MNVYVCVLVCMFMYSYVAFKVAVFTERETLYYEINAYFNAVECWDWITYKKVFRHTPDDCSTAPIETVNESSYLNV